MAGFFIHAAKLLMYEGSSPSPLDRKAIPHSQMARGLPCAAAKAWAALNAGRTVAFQAVAGVLGEAQVSSYASKPMTLT